MSQVSELLAEHTRNGRHLKNSKSVDCLLFWVFSNVYHFASVWSTALKLGCLTNFDMLFLVMGFIPLVDEIQFMQISSHYICIRSIHNTIPLVWQDQMKHWYYHHCNLENKDLYVNGLITVLVQCCMNCVWRFDKLKKLGSKPKFTWHQGMGWWPPLSVGRAWCVSHLGH